MTVWTVDKESNLYGSIYIFVIFWCSSAMMHLPGWSSSQMAFGIITKLILIKINGMCMRIGYTSPILIISFQFPKGITNNLPVAKSIELCICVIYTFFPICTHMCRCMCVCVCSHGRLMSMLGVFLCHNLMLERQNFLVSLTQQFN